jgi:hypothetical protein
MTDQSLCKSKNEDARAQKKPSKNKDGKLMLANSLTLEGYLTTEDDLEFISAQAHLLDSIFY